MNFKCLRGIKSSERQGPDAVGLVEGDVSMLLLGLVIVLNHLMDMMTLKLVKESISDSDNEEIQEIVLENEKGRVYKILLPRRNRMNLYSMVSVVLLWLVS